MIIESNQNIESSQDTSKDVQFDTEIQAKKDFDEGQKPKDIDEKYFEKNDQSSGPQNLKLFQADLEMIRSETTTDGESKVFFFIR